MTNTMKIIVESIPKESPDLLTVFSGLLTPVIALLAVYIAFRQHKIEKNRLKLELFDRRKAVFDAVASFFADLVSEGSVPYERTIQLSREMGLSYFLFDKKIRDFLSQIVLRSNRHFFLEKKMYDNNGLPRDMIEEDFQKILAEENEIQLWLMDQRDKVTGMFKSYFVIQ